jgi:hypothetical protein
MFELEEQSFLKKENKTRSFGLQNIKRKHLALIVLGLVALALTFWLRSPVSPKISTTTIPAFSGVKGSAMHAVFVSHYLSRLSSRSRHEPTTFSTIKRLGFEIAEKFKLSENDVGTMRSIAKIIGAYEDYREGGNPQFWNALAGLTRLGPKDMYDEIQADEDVEEVALQKNTLWVEIEKNLKQTDKKSFKPSSPLEEQFHSLMSGLQIGHKGYDELETFVNRLSEIELTTELESAQCQQYKSMLHFVSMIVKNSLLDEATSPAAYKFLIALEMLRLSLSMDSQDQMFGRYIELFAFRWTNLHYMNPQRTDEILKLIRGESKEQKLIAMVEKSRAEHCNSGQACNEFWAKLASDVWK